MAPYKPGVNVLAAPGELSGGDDSSGRTQISAAIQRHPRLCALLTQPQVEGLIGGVIGEDFNYTGGDGNFYTGDTGWHPDGNWGDLFAVKLAVYLDGERSRAPLLARRRFPAASLSASSGQCSRRRPAASASSQAPTSPATRSERRA